jgi:hypothetical protein
MAVTEQPPRTDVPGGTLKGVMKEAERIFQETGRYYGIEQLELKKRDPLGYESFHTRLLSMVISARET